MLVLLPPSETKRTGGDGPPLDLAAFSHPELGAVRKELINELVGLADDVPASRAALGLSERQDDEIERNAALWVSRTAPAITRYTGVLYDALDIGSLRGAAAGRARERLAVASALFGLLHAGDLIPAYRLSAGSSLPHPVGREAVHHGAGLAGRWRPVLTPVLARIAGEQLVVDLRSGAYVALAPVPGVVTVNVLTRRPDGSCRVVSHHNKAHKGTLARLLVSTRAEPDADDGAAAVARIASRAGLRIERTGEHHLDLILPR